MRKKYLSALLFGALLFASAGTFNDISNLQGQVDGIKADLEDLQAQISAGKWIQSVTPVEGGFTVTISDGQSFTIVNGQDGADGADGAAGAPGAAGADGTKITIGEDGYWYFDGKLYLMRKPQKSNHLILVKTDIGISTMKKVLQKNLLTRLWVPHTL